MSVDKRTRMSSKGRSCYYTVGHRLSGPAHPVYPFTRHRTCSPTLIFCSCYDSFKEVLSKGIVLLGPLACALVKLNYIYLCHFQDRKCGNRERERDRDRDRDRDSPEKRLTPLTKLGELGSEQVYNCTLKSKAGVQVNDNVKSCYFNEGSTKKVQIMLTKSCQ